MAVPTVITESLSVVGSYKAELKARINPNGLLTTFQFEYDTSSLFTTSSFTPLLTLSADSDYLDVKIIISSLIASSAYYYRIIATNISGTSTGTTKVFSTQNPTFTTPELDKESIETSQIGLKPFYRDFNQINPETKPFITNLQVIGQGISNILRCAKKTRFFKNGFGSELDTLPFELEDFYTQDLALGYLIEATQEWEPRVFIDKTHTQIVLYPDDYIMDIQAVFGLVGSNNKLFSVSVDIGGNL